ncbi:MAG: hypothetical protein WBD81_19890 [Collimonas pratensis]|uniref:hypothetical protein n=1 Tax=Collimonas pratensis TaxID=279113 RepID=UPI003C7314AF
MQKTQLNTARGIDLTDGFTTKKTNADWSFCVQIAIAANKIALRHGSFRKSVRKTWRAGGNGAALVQGWFDVSGIMFLSSMRKFISCVAWQLGSHRTLLLDMILIVRRVTYNRNKIMLSMHITDGSTWSR